MKRPAYTQEQFEEIINNSDKIENEFKNEFIKLH